MGEQLTTHDNRCIRHFKQQLNAAQSHTEFIGELVAALPTVISADVSSYNEVYSNQHIATSLVWPPDHPVIPDALDIFERHGDQNPLVTHAKKSNRIKARRIIDVDPQQTFYNSDLYNQFYGPLQLPYNMAVKIAPRVVVSLLRSRRDFSSHDVLLLDALSENIAYAYHNVVDLTRTQNNDVAANPETFAIQHLSFIEVTREGRIRLSTPASERMLATYTERTKHEHGYLPPLIRQWLHDELNQQATVYRPSAPLQIKDKPQGTLTIRLHRQGQHPLLLVKEVPKRRQFGLTTREGDIFILVVQGKTNQDIGNILHISPRTVQKHLQSLYVRLEVEDRNNIMRLGMELGLDQC